MQLLEVLPSKPFWFMISHFYVFLVEFTDRQVGVVVNDVVITTSDLGFDSLAVKSTKCREQLATAAMFVRNCVALALSRGDG